ncbi:MAG: glycosyltransferase [Caldilinea sp.]|nr:glycosyltransferase [Caldilinea sp.]MDW8442246.1 glycosyltransferase [Caldilineaceae bacterium]
MRLDEITVVLPTKNEENNIQSFLASLPSQVMLIVVDAGNDRTSVLIRAMRNGRTHIINSTAHIAAARNLGAHAAKTPWLLFTDADVAFAPDYFERLPRHADADAYFGAKCSLQSYASYYRWFVRGQRAMAWAGIPAVSGSNFLVHRSAFLATGGFDEMLTCNEDSEYGWRLARRGYKVVFAPELIVYERDHRRLRRGVVRKTLHSLIRCALLYTGLMPERLRRSDWGYWR